MNRKHRFGKCYYCVCTACDRFYCPWKHKIFKECFSCHERGKQLPRLDCDYFRHYLKSARFKYKIRPRSDLHQMGTYQLITKYGTFRGSFKDLFRIKQKIGGQLVQLDLLDYNLGDSYDEDN